MTEIDRQLDEETRAIIAFYGHRMSEPHMPAINLELWSKRISELVASLPSLKEAKTWRVGMP